MRVLIHHAPVLLLLCAALLCAALGLCAAAVPAAAQTSVLSWPQVAGSAGGRMRLILSITEADSIQSGLVDIKYDPGLISPIPTSLQQESYGQTVSALWGASIPADSTLRFVFATGDPVGYVGGGGPWVSIEFDLVDPGMSPLRFTEITLEHLPSTILPAIGVDGSINVTPAAVSPSTWGVVKGMYRDEGMGGVHGVSPNRAIH